MKRPNSKQREIRICAACSSKFSGAGENEFCPVCMLRQGLSGGVELGDSFSDDPVKLTPRDVRQRFEHYESSFRAAIKTAQEQRSISLVRRAKESYAEWRTGGKK
jgi:hypothetical protein